MASKPLTPNPNDAGSTINTDPSVSGENAYYIEDYYVNHGTIENSGSTITVLKHYQSFLINDGVINNDYNAELHNICTLNNYYDGTIDNNGLIENNIGAEEFWNDGHLNNYAAGRLVNNDSLLNSGKLINYGTIDNNSAWSDGSAGEHNIGGGLIRNQGTLSNSGTINNSNLIEVRPLGVLNNLGGLINNKGTLGTWAYGFIYINDAGAIINEQLGVLTNAGMIQNDGVINNTMSSQGPKAFVNNGLLSGNGSIRGAWTDHGTIKPGNSAGGMLIDGHYYKKGGSKEIELGGSYSGDGDRTSTEFDWIEITADLELSGELDVLLIDGFRLSAGDSFVITKVDGDLSGQYDGLDEGESLGRFKSDNGGTLDLFVTYQGGDGNDIELYTKSFFGVLPDSLSEPRMLGINEEDSLTGTSADEVIFGGSGDDQVAGGNGNDWIKGGYGDDTLKGERGADAYVLSSGNDVIDGFSFAENDRISVGDGVNLFFEQARDDLLIRGDGIETRLLDVDKGEFLAAELIILA